MVCPQTFFFGDAKFPSSFSVIKPTLITTLLSTTRLELDPELFPFKTGFVVWLVNLNALRSSSLEAKYYDFVDEEEEARSSSGVLILALGCDISATLEPLLKQNLCPGFTFQIDPHQTPNSETPPFWMRRENR